MLQNPEQRFSDIRAGRPDSNDRFRGGDATHDGNAFFGIAAIIVVFEGDLALGAVAERDASGIVDLLERRLQRRFAVDTEDAHDTRLGTEPGDFDRTLLSPGG